MNRRRGGAVALDPRPPSMARAERPAGAWATRAGPRQLAAAAAAARPAMRQPPLVSHDPDPVANKNPPVAQIPKAPPRVELVFALDTTGSMGGLLDGAKRKIWSIAQFIANGQPK